MTHGGGEEIDLEPIEAILQQACGLSLSTALRRALKGSVERAAQSLGLSASHFVRKLKEGESESVACLVEHSVIGETYFFRHPEQLSALRERLERDFADVRALTLWSAGCASGEEPYSLAMTLAEAGRKRCLDRVLGTDVSERALRTAREARYGKWSLRRLEPHLRQRYFEPDGERLKVRDSVRQKVELRRHNLVEDAPPVSGCQIILCRNVLIYFSAPTAAKVLHNLYGALAPGGLLILGPVEVPQAAPLALEWIEVQGATILRKPLGPPPRRNTPARRHTPSRPLPRARPAAGTKAVSAPARPPPRLPTRFEQAREAARLGQLDEAERLARGAAAEDLCPESYLLLSMAAESRGDLQGAVEQVRRALYLEPTLATGHAQLVALFQRLGRSTEAERSRRNALEALQGMDEATILKGVEAITAGALRKALQTSSRR
ncbi:MAG: chemotaxis protein CheR [Deltaproteobacteria bacterium]|nr:chemotaxis protein CheR [Deltaproteobacteria bacterium]